jgi:hypothetical protein
MRLFVVGLPLLGLVSMPASWLLLEKLKWALIPQVQPLRMLLFVAVMTQFLAAAAGARAVMKRRWAEAGAWLAPALLIALVPVWTEPAAWHIPSYPKLHTPELEQLSAWARESTPRDAVFLFPDAGHGLWPGIFRSEALRAVYVDWKGGGQVNYGAAFAGEWWTRWRLTMADGFHQADVGQYEGLGIGYFVLQRKSRLARPAVFENAGYAVYRVK